MVAGLYWITQVLPKILFTYLYVAQGGAPNYTKSLALFLLWTYNRELLPTTSGCIHVYNKVKSLLSRII